MGPLLLAVASLAGSAAQIGQEKPRVLFLTHSAGHRHEVTTRGEDGALSLAETALRDFAVTRFVVDCTQDCSVITAENLARYRAVVFHTTGELPIPEPGRAALLDFVRGGRGFVGIHSAADTFYEWPAYGEMLGGVFDGHPWHQNVRVRVEDVQHRAAEEFDSVEFEIEDEIYQFKNWDRSKVRTILSLDPTSVDLAAKEVRRSDRDFPLAWSKPYGAGRVFYTAFGHREDVWRDRRFLGHLTSGIAWSASSPVQDGEGFFPVPLESSAGAWRDATLWINRGARPREDLRRPDPRHEPAHPAWAIRWYADRSFRNFILRLETERAPIAEGPRILVRFPDPSVHASLLEGVAHEVPFGGDGMGSARPSTRLADGWNEAEVTCVGREVTARLNGRVVSRRVRDGDPEGFIGLKSRVDGGANGVRRVRVKPLPDDAVAYHVLSDGNVDGWTMAGPGGFDLVDGALVSRGGMGLLWNERPLRDFLLLLDSRVSRREDNSGVFVRFPDPGDDPWVAVRQGYEIQICDTAGAKHRTGSIYDFQDSRSVPTKPPGEWNHLGILARGGHYLVRLNGETVNEYDGDRSLEGRIGLQNHDDASRVSFRDIRVVELSAAPKSEVKR